MRAAQLQEDGEDMCRMIRKLIGGSRLDAVEIYRMEKLIESGRGKTEEVRLLIESVRPLLTSQELYLLSLCAEFGYFREVDPEEALRLAMQGTAEDQTGACHAQAGCLRENMDEMEEAQELYLMAAERGSAVGLRRMADFSEEQLLDTEAAYQYMRESAELGDPAAIDGLACYIEHGEEQDYARAMQLYQKAASLGEEEAMEHLASMYAEGKGVRRDVRKAAHWFRRAAFEGNRQAEEALVALQAEDAQTTVPWGEWKPDWFLHRWVTPDIHNEMMTVLKLHLRGQQTPFGMLPKGLVMAVLFWLCCEPRVTESMMLRATSKKVDHLVSEMANIKSQLSSIMGILETLQRNT